MFIATAIALGIYTAAAGWPATACACFAAAMILLALNDAEDDPNEEEV